MTNESKPAIINADNPDLVTESSSQRSRAVLVIDDEAHVCSALYRLLRSEDLTVLVAASVDEGLLILAQHEVGVAIVDYRMKTRNGAEFLREIKHLYPKTIRIMLTGYTDSSILIDAVNQGAPFKIMTKPWNDSLLLEYVREGLHLYDAY